MIAIVLGEASILVKLKFGLFCKRKWPSFPYATLGWGLASLMVLGIKTHLWSCIHWWYSLEVFQGYGILVITLWFNVHLVFTILMSQFTISVEVVLRHFHRHCYESSLLWFFIGEGLGRLGSNYGWTRWTQIFTWFGSPDRNTVRSRERWVLYCCVFAQVWVELTQKESEDSNVCPAFYSTRTCSYIETKTRQVAPG
jgi:hypothetical protein